MWGRWLAWAHGVGAMMLPATAAAAAGGGGVNLPLLTGPAPHATAGGAPGHGAEARALGALDAEVWLSSLPGGQNVYMDSSSCHQSNVF
jgi:hypothetical protein